MEEKKLAILEQKKGEKRIAEREEKEGKKKRLKEKKNERKERKQRKERKKKEEVCSFFFLFWYSHFGIKVEKYKKIHPNFCN